MSDTAALIAQNIRRGTTRRRSFLSAEERAARSAALIARLTDEQARRDGIELPAAAAPEAMDPAAAAYSLNTEGEGETSDDQPVATTTGTEQPAAEPKPEAWPTLAPDAHQTPESAQPQAPATKPAKEDKAPKAPKAPKGEIKQPQDADDWTDPTTPP